jgi:hypothetical protein
MQNERFDDLVRELKSCQNVFLDTETCGLHGFVVLIQWACDDGEIHLWDVWKEPVWQSLHLVELFMDRTMVYFNAAFDQFHLCKMYTTFDLADPDWIPEDHIDEIAELETKAMDGPCLKPRNTLDLMLHARRGPYQSLMARNDIRIRRVPTELAWPLAQELESRIEFDNIYFARRRDPEAPRWNVFDIEKDGEVDPNFKDVVLKFSPAGGLKFLAEHALGLKPRFHFRDVEVDSQYHPKELGYAPTAKAVSRKSRDWEVYKDGKLVGHAWPGVIKVHIEHWAKKSDAREYARDDIVYTRGLYEHFECPEPGDDDSVLACMVAATRWKGFKIDVKGVKRLLRDAKEVVDNAPLNINKPKEVRRYVTEVMDDMESMILYQSTKKSNLESISRWELDPEEIDVECSKCDGAGCLRCNGSGVFNPLDGKHPAAIRASEVLRIKFAAKEVELYRKLLKAGRFHASFKVIGTLSSRMSGGDGLNPQGIKATDTVRSLFPMAFKDEVLSLGDFSAFEVTLADAVWSDENLRADLQSGKKIHALFGSALSGLSYDEVVATKGTQDDWYTRGKQGVFGTFYGGDERTLVRNLGVTEEVAREAFQTLSKRYPKMGESRQKTFDRLCTMKQPHAGGPVYWNEPSDYVESFLGFRRYFTLENRVCKTLFQLAQKPPKEWRKCKIKVRRRDKDQFAVGAVASALYGAAFSIQAGNMRAGANHEIQSPGAQITKRVQRRIWDLQPHGVQPWRVRNMNVHDEVLCAHDEDMTEAVTERIRGAVEEYVDKVPLIGMEWYQLVKDWSGKLGGQGQKVELGTVL